MEETNQFYTNKLRVRVCGICIQNNAILLVCHRGLVNGNDFWAPPGGGLVFGESVRNGLKREFLEETGLEIKSGRFLFFNEFLKPPLHALELFFEVQPVGGNLIIGSDPDLPADNQLIIDVKYVTLLELQKIPLNQKHAIFHELVNFDDIFIPHHRFLNEK
jgi:ADP-ribose pyrophosphatase YjhB (NUDIX family)